MWGREGDGRGTKNIPKRLEEYPNPQGGVDNSETKIFQNRDGQIEG